MIIARPTSGVFSNINPPLTKYAIVNYIPVTWIGLFHCRHCIRFESMGVEPPFLYDPPSRYSFTGPTEKGFNPKAASQASLLPPRPRPKQEGPLIDTRELNRHPDSYFIV